MCRHSVSCAAVTRVRFSFSISLAIVLAGIFLLQSTAASHESIGSVSTALVLTQDSRVEYYLSIPPTLQSRMLDMSATEWYRDYFSRTLTIETSDTRCHLDNISPFSRQTSGNSIVHLSFQCPLAVRDLRITSETFLDLDDKHLQLVKLVAPDDLGHILREGMLNLEHREMFIAEVRSGGSLFSQRVWRFSRIGIEHILSGYDHILFVVAVLLVAASFMDALKLVTSFTVAHSITLALAFFGVVSISSAVVEPLIALTIVFVAFDNLVDHNFKRRWLLIFVFGLIHGLGFVGVLKEITFSQDELLTSLVAFNLGIEAGQLLIVIPLMLVLYRLREWSLRPALLRISSLAMGAIGLVWFVQRVPIKPMFGAIGS